MHLLLARVQSQLGLLDAIIIQKYNDEDGNKMIMVKDKKKVIQNSVVNISKSRAISRFKNKSQSMERK